MNRKLVPKKEKHAKKHETPVIKEMLTETR